MATCRSSPARRARSSACSVSRTMSAFTAVGSSPTCSASSSARDAHSAASTPWLPRSQLKASTDRPARVRAGVEVTPAAKPPRVPSARTPASGPGTRGSPRGGPAHRPPGACLPRPVDLERVLERSDPFFVLVRQVAGLGLVLEEVRASLAAEARRRSETRGRTARRPPDARLPPRRARRPRARNASTPPHREQPRRDGRDARDRPFLGGSARAASAGDGSRARGPVRPIPRRQAARARGGTRFPAGSDRSIPEARQSSRSSARLTEERLEQPELRLRRDERHGLEQGPRRR